MDLMEAMSLDSGPSNGFVGRSPSTVAAELVDGALPIFDVESVQLQFSIAADFVAAQVANNVIVLALSNGRILRIDLNKPEDIDGGCGSALTIPACPPLDFPLALANSQM